MKKLITLVILCCFAYLAHSKIIETAYELGFIEKYQVTALEKANDTVECSVFAWGFINQDGLEDNYNRCIADYKNQGYEVVSVQGT